MKITGNEGKKFDPIDAGTISAVCFGIVDVGIQENYMGGAPQRKVYFMFEVDQQAKNEKGETFNRTISKDYTVSLNEKANLRKMLEGWLNRNLTEQEIKEGIDLKDFLGKPCLLNIQHKKKESGVYANVSSISPLMKGMTPLKPLNPFLHFTLDTDEMPKEKIFEEFDKLPNWLQKIIMQSPTFINLKKEEVTLKPVDDSDLPF